MVRQCVALFRPAMLRQRHDRQRHAAQPRRAAPRTFQARVFASTAVRSTCRGRSFNMATAPTPGVVSDLPSPAFCVLRERVEANCRAMMEKAAVCGVQLRPHVKTHKTLEIARLQVATPASRGIVVSTVAEAEFFADGGFADVLYGVPLEPSKLPRLAALHSRIQLHVLLDSTAALDALAACPQPTPWSVFLKVDAGYRRAGIDPESGGFSALAKAVSEAPAATLAGVYSHSGNSYNCAGASAADVAAAARAVGEAEAACMAAATTTLRGCGVDVGVVSVGATPSIATAERAGDVTEWHPGNYVFYDRQQLASGSIPSADRVACFVHTRVVGVYPHRAELLVDAGGMALHKDSGGVEGWGTIVGHPHLILTRISQEVGVVGVAAGSTRDDVDWGAFKLGTALRVVPNHSCMTAAMHDVYWVVEGDDTVTAQWKPCKGW